MVFMQATNLLRFPRTLQLSFYVAVLRTIVRLDPQTAVAPQLPLGAKPVRGLDQGDQQRCPNRTDGRNLPESLAGAMLPALGQKFASYVSPQNLQPIQLEIEQLGPTAHPSFADLAQPFGPMA